MEAQLLRLLEDLSVTPVIHKPSNVALDELQRAFRVKSRVGSSLGVATEWWKLFDLRLLERGSRHLLHRYVITKVSEDADRHLSELGNPLQLAERLHWLWSHTAVECFGLFRRALYGPGSRPALRFNTPLLLALFDGSAWPAKSGAQFVLC